MNEITLTGNLTADPELRYTATGTPVCNFTVAVSNRTKDKATGEWKDDNALFLRCTTWNQMGENTAGSLHKGVRVMVTGVLQQRSYQDRNGVERTSFEMLVNEVGASMRYATLQVTRAQSANNGRQGQGEPTHTLPQPAFQQPTPQPTNNPFTQPAGGQPSDPWATNQPALDYDAPPF